MEGREASGWVGHVDRRLTDPRYSASRTEDDFLRALPLADRLRIAAVDLAFTGAPRVLVEAVWRASEETAMPLVKPRPRACDAASER